MTTNELKNKELKEGQKVWLKFTTGVFRPAVLLRRPAGEGDLWMFEDLSTHKTFAQNPYARTLESIEEMVSHD